jgi:hypothetical protein
MSSLPNLSSTDNSVRAGMTFGIELEFIVAFPDNYFNFTEDAISAISRALVAAGIDSTGHECYDVDAVIFCNKPEFSQWTVKRELGLFLSDSEQAFINPRETRTCGVEISSRKFSFADIEDWKKELKAVLVVLYEFSQSGIKILTNATTGFHVHIGFGDETVSLRTAKGVLQFCTAFEDRLDALYATDRIDVDCAASADNGAHFNAGLTWHFQENKVTDFGPNVFHWLASIEEATSYQQLGAFFKNHCDFDLSLVTNAHYATVNLDNLYTDDMSLFMHSKSMGTIEFRQHQGTLILEEIFAQVELMRTIVTWCHFASDLKFLELFSQVSNPNFTLKSLCEAIGARSALLQYYEGAFSPDKEHAYMINYHIAQAKLRAGNHDELGNLELQNFVESYQRQHRTAVTNKISNKKMKGTYADLKTTAESKFGVAHEYKCFIQANRHYYPTQELSTLARTMVFQQLNGNKSSWNP